MANNSLRLGKLLLGNRAIAERQSARACFAGHGLPGIGIAQEQASVFKSCAKSDSAISRRYGGHRLGLAICKQLMKSSGGRIWSRVKRGTGSTLSHVGCPASFHPTDTLAGRVYTSDTFAEQLPYGLKLAKTIGRTSRLPADFGAAQGQSGCGR